MSINRSSCLVQNRRGKISKPILIGSSVISIVSLGVVWALVSYLIRPMENENVGGENEEVVAKVDSENDTDKLVQHASFHPPTETGYVGSDACAKCHEELYESYLKHPMYGSTRRVEDDPNPPPVNDEKKYVAGVQRFYEVEMTETGGMIHREKMVDADGEVIFDDAQLMDFVVGSGQRGKAYLAQRDDLVFMSPLNWYGRTETWDMAPDYKKDDPRRFSRRCNEICLGCHAGRLNVDVRMGDRYKTPVFLEMAIGCERCHGPGEDHIAFHEGAKASSLDPIVNPASLTHTERESLCMQCHLQPSRSRVKRYGRSNLDFRAGQVIGDVWAVVETNSGVGVDGKTQSVRHVQQLRESACYQSSPQGMDCTSCHDPHRVPEANELDVFYRNKCLDCHNDGSCAETQERRTEKNDSCIACHMPSLNVTGEAHVAQTDHRILRQPTQQRETKTPPLGLSLIQGQENLLTDVELDRVEMLFQLFETSRSSQQLSPELRKRLDELVEIFPEDGMLVLGQGTIAWSENNQKKALECFEKAATIAESQELALSNLMDISYLAMKWDKVLDYTGKLLEINPYVARAYAIRSDALLSMGRVDEAIASAKQALEVDPSMEAIHGWLVMVYQELKMPEEQRKHEQIIARMQNAKLPPEVTGTE